jgi:hypothetical protein
MFTASRSRLATALLDCRRQLRPDAVVWVSWPKKASGVPTDVSEDTIREVAPAARLRGHQSLCRGCHMVGIEAHAAERICDEPEPLTAPRRPSRHASHPYEAAVVCALAISGSIISAEQGKRREPVVGGPCEGCDLAFEGMPSKLEWFSRIAPEGEPGKPLRIVGVVRDAMNWPVPGIIVYAYQTTRPASIPKARRRTACCAGGQRPTNTETTGSTPFDPVAIRTARFHSTSACT